MPELSRPRRSASGSTSAPATSRPRSTASRTCSSTWRSRAPHPQRPRHRRGDRARRRQPQRLHLARAHRLLRPVLKEDVALGVDILADILQQLGPSIPTSWSASARRPAGDRPGVKDTPDDLVFDLFQETAFPDQPMGRPVLGRPRRSWRCRARIFSPTWPATTASNMVLSAAGRVEHDQLVDLAEKSFGSVPRAPPAVPPVPLAMPAATAVSTPRARAGASGAGLPGRRLSRSRLLRACI